MNGALKWKGQMERMNRKQEPTARQRPTAVSLRQAKNDYYDCIARYGCDSAEAHVAQILWRKLRSKSRLAQVIAA